MLDWVERVSNAVWIEKRRRRRRRRRDETE
jgi:hypothetical protein